MTGVSTPVFPYLNLPSEIGEQVPQDCSRLLVATSKPHFCLKHNAEISRMQLGAQLEPKFR